MIEIQISGFGRKPGKGYPSDLPDDRADDLLIVLGRINEELKYFLSSDTVGIEVHNSYVYSLTDKEVVPSIVITAGSVPKVKSVESVIKRALFGERLGEVKLRPIQITTRVY